MKIEKDPQNFNVKMLVKIHSFSRTYKKLKKRIKEKYHKEINNTLKIFLMKRIQNIIVKAFMILVSICHVKIFKLLVINW